jgi:ribosomal protein L37E
MSFRRAIWADDSTVTRCTKCRGEFSYTVKKHHCRKCGLIFCGNCTKNRMIVPQEQLVARPQSVWSKWSEKIISDEDNYRCPQRVCDPCSFQLKDLQPELRMAVSRYVFNIFEKIVVC